LWTSDDVEEWSAALHALDARMVASGKKTKYGSLGPLHKKWKALGPPLVAAGELGKEDLRTIMAFKLTRGKMRPLMRFVDAAHDGALRRASRAALSALQAPHCGPGFDAFKPIAGVGVATASLIFAAADPRFVIMSDEAMEVTCGAPPHGKTYDLAAYGELLRACTRKADALGWPPRDVELALFSASLDGRASKKVSTKKRVGTKKETAKTVAAKKKVVTKKRTRAKR